MRYYHLSLARNTTSLWGTLIFWSALDSSTQHGSQKRSDKRHSPNFCYTLKQYHWICSAWANSSMFPKLFCICCVQNTTSPWGTLEVPFFSVLLRRSRSYSWFMSINVKIRSADLIMHRAKKFYYHHFPIFSCSTSAQLPNQLFK